jgi:HD-GYP domain-containing protein (c-di-GMP phosphodiesterase class II)
LDVPFCHHERWDGTGYPRRLKGEEIPLAARLFAVVDVWDALRSDRPYRSRWPEIQVRAHLRAGAGSHFDPSVVDQFLRLLAEPAEPAAVRTGPLSSASVPAGPATARADPPALALPPLPLQSAAPSGL